MKKLFAGVSLTFALIGMGTSPIAFADSVPNHVSSVSSNSPGVAASLPGDYYVVNTWYYTDDSCERGWGIFINEYNNKNIYSGHMCAPNAWGKFTLIAFYK